MDAEKLSYVRGSSHGHRRNGGTQGPQVDPPRHPGPTLSHQPPGPGVKTAGNGKLGDNLSEHQGYQQLPQPNKQIAPEHRWTASGDRKGENRVDANHRRQVGEAKREVRPQAHGAIELGVIAEGFELSRVSFRCGWLWCHENPLWFPCAPLFLLVQTFVPLCFKFSPSAERPST